ncbi:MAG TPA: beta-3-deoxy-D-manno-oct-2-ulosonic acid transferase [Stellaceae bacterium]|nr:beta-3-deoxy-D-manno-oct-2-ulosonic acid transferase [Stellaceae bacterium]
MRPASGTARAMLFPELPGGATVRFSEGILRAPRRGRQPPPLLSAVACDGSTSPDAVLAQRGWESPDLLARAAATRRALVAARIGGGWWQDGGVLPPGDGYAVADLGEPPVASCAPTAGDRVPAAMTDRPCDPWRVIARAGRVCSAGGELGFLALLAGVPVSASAPAFYTGWGVTDDACTVPRRPFRRSVDEIFAGACLIATRCRDPFRDAPAHFEAVLDILADWRRLEEANRGIAACVGMSLWKRRRVAGFVRSSAGVPRFCRSAAAALADAAETGGAIAGWASRLPAGLAEEAARRGVRLIRVEDGFVRSKGLGSDFMPPASLVFDRGGMYYDPRSDNDLGRILRETEFAPSLVARAERLAAQLVARGITKYNLAGRAAMPTVPAGRRRILVPGQVEDDLSIIDGAGAVRTNLALLTEVRRTDPDAFILYKPHPDVLAGHRKGAVSESRALGFADVIVEKGSLAALLAQVDEVHTMTSLAGFEALLRRRRVVVYGRPFYAGWGLTEDRPPFDRGRHLSLAELVAGALVLYPRYLDPLTRLPCGPEIIIERLDRPELWRPGLLIAARRLQGVALRRLRAAVAALPAPATLPVRRLRAQPRP